MNIVMLPIPFPHAFTPLSIKQYMKSIALTATKQNLQCKEQEPMVVKYLFQSQFF